jgi:hypothetical protein
MNSCGVFTCTLYLYCCTISKRTKQNVMNVWWFCCTSSLYKAPDTPQWCADHAECTSTTICCSSVYFLDHNISKTGSSLYLACRMGFSSSSSRQNPPPPPHAHTHTHTRARTHKSCMLHVGTWHRVPPLGWTHQWRRVMWGQGAVVLMATTSNRQTSGRQHWNQQSALAQHKASRTKRTHPPPTCANTCSAVPGEWNGNCQSQLLLTSRAVEGFSCVATVSHSYYWHHGQWRASVVWQLSAALQMGASYWCDNYRSQ